MNVRIGVRLLRVIDVLKFLCERGLALRGSDSKIGSIHNGNFLGIMELLSLYDPFLAEHIRKHGNRGRGHSNYLSHIIYEELIRIMSDMVLNIIIEELKSAKYYSISVDSTPDIKHVDQLSFTVRYVIPTGPVERFLCFIPMKGHKGEDIADIIFEFLNGKTISISDCRGQSYDNASNMSGKYIGVQQRVKEKCQYVDYCPCCGHSLNLVGSCTVENCQASWELFSIIQKLYVFYAASTHRWQKQCEMPDEIDNSLVVKRIVETRWSARSDAVRALISAYRGHITLLNNFSCDSDETLECRRDSTGLASNLSKLETGILVTTWGELLKRIQETNLKLQTAGLALNTAVSLLKSLCSFVEDMRDRYDEMEIKGMEMCGNKVYEAEIRRQRRRKKQFDEDEDEDATYDDLEPDRNLKLRRISLSQQSPSGISSSVLEIWIPIRTFRSE